MAPIPPPILFSGFSQGSPLIGKFARQAAADGSRDGRDLTGMNSCWISAIEAARRSKALSDDGARALNLLADANDGSGMFPEFSYRIRTQPEWLAIPEGLLVGALARPYTPPGPRRLSHVMISLGKGEVAGSNNGVLDKPGNWCVFNLDEVMTWAGNFAYHDGREFEVRVRPIQDREAGSNCFIQ